MNGNRFIDRETKEQIKNYYEEKRKEIYGTCNCGDDAECYAYLARTNFNAIPRKWYEIFTIRTLPIQDINILPNVSKKDYVIDMNIPIVTAGICIDDKAISLFISGKHNCIGVDKNNNYYEVLYIKKNCILYEGNANEYLDYRELEKFLKENNPELIKKIDTIPKTPSEVENIIFEIWEFLYSKLVYVHTSVWSKYSICTIPNSINSIIWNVSIDDYENFHTGCSAYEEISWLVNHKERFKEKNVTLYGQIFRPIKKKEDSNTAQVNINNEEHETKSSQDSFKIGCCEALFLIVTMIINICGILGTFASEDMGSGLKIIYIGIMIISCVAAFVNGSKKNNLTGTIFGTSCILGVLNLIWLYWLLNCQ